MREWLPVLPPPQHVLRGLPSNAEVVGNERDALCVGCGDDSADPAESGRVANADRVRVAEEHDVHLGRAHSAGSFSGAYLSSGWRFIRQSLCRVFQTPSPANAELQQGTFSQNCDPVVTRGACGE